MPINWKMHNCFILESGGKTLAHNLWPIDYKTQSDSQDVKMWKKKMCPLIGEYNDIYYLVSAFTCYKLC